MLNNRLGLILLLTLVFAVNWAETTVEDRLKTNPVTEKGSDIAASVQAVEPPFDFEYHDVTNRVAIYGYSTAYFFAFPLLSLLVAVALFRRQEIAPFRTFSLAVAIDYTLSLPFFVFFPVPERWAVSESGAVLLSDLWSSSFIQIFRHVSGLDNCFPSFHTSLTVVMMACCYVFRVRLRTVVLCLGLVIILSTLILGIHWLPDIAAGLALGGLSVALALRLTDTAGCWQPSWGRRFWRTVVHSAS